MNSLTNTSFRRIAGASRGLYRRSFQLRSLSSSVTFDWEDPLSSKNIFSEQEIDIQDTARAYCQERLLPRIIGWFFLKYMI